MAENKSKEYTVDFRGSNDGTSYTYRSKTIKANSASAAIKIVKGLYKFVKVVGTRQR